MYNSYFDFKKDPFSVKLDPDFFYQAPSWKSVYEWFSGQILARQGVLMLVGGEGVGKTLLLFQIVARLQSRAKFVYFHVASDSFEEFIDNLCDEIALDVSGKLLIDKIVQLNTYLKKEKNTRIVVVVDDAQNLKDSVLHDVLLMSTPPNKGRASIQIVLSGLPELEEKYNQLKRKSLALDSDKVFLYSLKSLDYSGVREYIQQRLSAVGCNEDTLFDDPAITRITHYSKGVPLVVNNLCRLSLQHAAEQEITVISQEIVDQISINYFAEQAISQPNRPVVKEVGFSDKLSQLIDSLPGRFANLSEQISESSESAIAGIKRIKPQYAVIGLAALSVLAISFYIAQSDSSEGPASSAEIVSVDQSDMQNDSSPVTVLNRSASQVVNGDSDIASFESNDDQRNGSLSNDAIAVVSTDASTTDGEIARTFLYELEQAGQSVDLGAVYDKAESLTAESNLKGAYLLYFYAAKSGYSDAAFKLAQFADPETFESNRSLLDSPNSVQAHKWYQQAVLAGHPNAGESLDRLRSQVEQLAASGDERAYQLTLQWR